MKSILASFLLVLPVLPVMGQAPGIPGIVPEEVDDPDAQPPAAAIAGGIPDPDAVVIPGNVLFEYPNLDGQAAANLYFKHTGKRVIVQSAAGAAEFKIIQPGPLTNAEIASLLEKQMLLEGFALIPSGPNEVKMVLNTAAEVGPEVLGPGDDLPEGDQFVTYVMSLQFLKPEEALRAFQQVVGSYGPSGRVAAVPNAASLIINANTALVRSLIELKNQIDVPSARVGTKFVDVVYADVEDLAERLNEIFNNQTAQNQSAGVQRTQQPQANTGANQIPGLNIAVDVAGGGAAGEDTPINIQPDTRTNRIFLMGRPVDLVFVEGLIQDFDSPTSARNFLRRKLRYLPVLEFLPVAGDALERTLEASAVGAGGGALGNRATNNRTQAGGAANARTAVGQGGDDGTAARAQLTQQQVQTAPESMLVGKTLLVADNISNSIVVQGPPHHVEIVENLLEELDQPSEQVAITAVFGRYDVTKGQNFGIDLGNLLESISGDLDLAGQLRNGVPSVVDPTTLVDFNTLLGASGAAGNGLSLYGVLGDEFGIFVNALETNTDFVAISRPTVFTTNNHEARISSGARIAVPTSTFTGGNVGTGQTTNVEFRDVVLELVVLPLVNDENTVTLNISLVRDDLGEDRNIGELIVPDIITDEISTIVTVPNRSTIILGGLITETDRNSKTGVPILSSIPGIRRLFSRTTAAVERQELVILIHPSIINDDRKLENYQRLYDSDSEISPRARATMAPYGVLPGRGVYPEQPLYYDKGGQAPVPSPVGAPVVEQAAPLQRTQSPIIATSPSQKALQNTRNDLQNKRRR